MSLIKVTIMQKNLKEGLNINLFKKLAPLKSDILVFPEYFFVDNSCRKPENLLEKSKHALDWLLKLNQSYKGIIVGGSIIREDKGKLFNASPIIIDGKVVDWYCKRELTDEEKKYLTPGNGAGIFMLRYIRFGVLICNDIKKREYLDELKQDDVRLVFVLVASPKKKETIEEKFKRDEELFLKPARENNQIIIKCAAVGEIMSKPLQGRSLMVTKEGVAWRVRPDDEDQEIIKNLMVEL